MTVFGDTNDMPSEIRKLHKEINLLRDQAEFQPILTTGRSDDGFGASVGSKTMNSQGVWSLTPVIHSVIDNPAVSGTTYDMIELISACAVIDKNTLQGASVTELDVKTIRMGSINESGVDAKNSAPNGTILFIKPINGKKITLKAGGNIHISQDVTLDDKAFAILQFYVTADEVVTPPADGSNPFPEENKKWVLLTGGGGTSINAIKEPCRCATTGNNISPLAIGSTVDGTTIVVDDRVLYKNQTDAEDNGIYVCTNINGIVATMKRATDFDDDSEVKAGTIVTVNEGTANGNKLFMMTEDVDPIIVGTTDINFTLVTSVDTSLDYVWSGVHKFQNALTELGNEGTDVIKVIGEINGVAPFNDIQNPDGSGNNDYDIPSGSAGMNVDTSIIMNTHNIYDLDQLVFARGSSSLIPAWEDDHVGIEFTQASNGTDTGLGYHVANNNSTTQHHRFFVNAHYDDEEELRIGADGIKFGTNTTPTAKGSIFFDGTDLKVITNSDNNVVNLSNLGTVKPDDEITWTDKHVWDNTTTWLETYTSDSVKATNCHVKIQGDGLEHDDYDYTDYDDNPSQRVMEIGKYGTHEVKIIAEVTGHGNAVIVDPSSTDGTSEFTIPNSDPSISMKCALVMNTFSIYDLDQIVFGQGPSSTSPPMLNNWVGVQANTGEDTSGGSSPPNPTLNGMSFHVPDNKEFFFKVGKGTAGEEATGSYVTEIFRVSENGIKIAGSTAPSSLANGMIWHNSTDNKVYARSNGVSVELGSGSGGGSDNLGNHTATQSLNMAGEMIMDTTMVGISNASGTNIGSYAGEIDSSTNVGLISFERIRMQDVTNEIATFTDSDRDGIDFKADLDMNTFDITNVDGIKFGTGSSSNDTVGSTEYGIEVKGGTSPTAMNFNVPSGKHFYFETGGSTSFALIGKNLLIYDSGTDTTGNGLMWRNGNDVKVYSGGAERNMSLIGTGGGSVAKLDDIGDCTIGSTPTSNTILKEFNGGWVDGNVTYANIDASTWADFTTHLKPNYDGQYDLGSSTREWRNLYIDGTAYIDTLSLEGGSSGYVLSTNGSGTLSWVAQSGGSSGANTTLSNLGYTSINTDLIPDGNKSLGNTSNRWRYLYVYYEAFLPDTYMDGDIDCNNNEIIDCGGLEVTQIGARGTATAINIADDLDLDALGKFIRFDNSTSTTVSGNQASVNGGGGMSCEAFLKIKIGSAVKYIAYWS